MSFLTDAVFYGVEYMIWNATLRKNLSRQMIRMNHNAFFRNSGRKLTRAFTAESFSRNIETVRLAFDKHSPPSNVVPRGSPIIFLHGLFGSKINNRTVSKYEGDK
jgi:hypothetical protein